MLFVVGDIVNVSLWSKGHTVQCSVGGLEAVRSARPVEQHRTAWQCAFTTYVSVILLQGGVGLGPHPGEHSTHDEATGEYRGDTHTHGHTQSIAEHQY